MLETKQQVLETYQPQAQLCQALNHPVRLAILDILREGEQCVCHMEAILGLRQAYISQHLMLLREAGLVEDRRDGWNIFYHVSRPEVHQIADALRMLAGQPRRKLVHIHAPTECPCPKCNS
jgi:ArsR family transcriptional regulator